MLSVSMREWHSGSNSNAYRIEKVLLIHSYIHMFISRMVNISFSLTLFFFFSLSRLLQMVNISSFFFFSFCCVGSLLWRMGTRVHRPCSCGMWAYLPHGMWDVSFLTRDQTHVPCIGRQILNHWTTREVPKW